MDTLDILKAKKQITDDDDLQVVVLTGDGSANDIGLSATSGAMVRDLDFLYICYDNEGYGNTGWDYAPKETVNIGKLAVRSGVWPLKEYKDGKVVHTKIPLQRKPVEEYLKQQGRYKHLFEPRRDEEMLKSIQGTIDRLGRY